MILSYAEVEDILKFLDTLDTCDQMRISPQLTDENVFLLGMIQGHLHRWLRENE